MGTKGKQIEVGSAMDADRGRMLFRISIPYDLIKNLNTLEVLSVQEETDPAAWLETLAGIIRSAAEGQ